VHQPFCAIPRQGARTLYDQFTRYRLLILPHYVDSSRMRSGIDAEHN